MSMTQMSRVDALIAKLHEHRANLDLIDFPCEIADFTVLELERLSAGLSQAIPSKPLTVH